MMRRKSADFCAKRFVVAPINCCVIELEMSPLGTQGRDFVDPTNLFSRVPFDFINEPFSRGLCSARCYLRLTQLTLSFVHLFAPSGP